MADPIFRYPLDLLGTSPTNRVVDEAHEIGSVTNRIFIADYGPFFSAGHVVKDADTGAELIPAVDYALVHYYEEASSRTGQAVYSGVRILNTDVGSNVTLTAQMVGGEYSWSTYALAIALQALENDNRDVGWGDLIGVPSDWTPSSHYHPGDDIYGLKKLVDQVADVAAAIRDGDAASRSLLIQQIMTKFNAFDNKYMTVLSGQQYIDDRVGQRLEQVLVEYTNVLNQHIEDQNDPHDVTKEQVGLDKVANYAPASIQQTVEGIAADLLVTVAGLKATLENLLGDVAVFGFTVVEGPRELEVGGRYYATTTSVLTLPDPATIGTGDFVTVVKARAAQPKVTVKNPVNESIASDAGVSRTLILNANFEIKFIWSGAQWEAVYSVNKVNNNGASIVAELSANR